jgi:hypothetical protein
VEARAPDREVDYVRTLLPAYHAENQRTKSNVGGSGLSGQVVVEVGDEAGRRLARWVSERDELLDVVRATDERGGVPLKESLGDLTSEGLGIAGRSQLWE